MKVKKAKETLDEINARLTINKRFAFTRWGDGRLLMLDPHYPGEPLDHGQKPLLRELLLKAAAESDPDWLVGVHAGIEQEPGMRRGTFGATKLEDRLLSIIEKHIAKRDEYENPVPFHYCALFDPEPLFAFVEKIRMRNTLVVGGAHLEKTARFFRTAPAFLSVPTVESFKNRSKITELLNDAINGGIDTILFAAGCLSPVLQHWIFQEGKNVATIDVGSFLDLCAGLDTRQFIKDNPDQASNFLFHLEEKYKINA